jgi:hypothetical protein
MEYLRLKKIYSLGDDEHLSLLIYYKSQSRIGTKPELNVNCIPSFSIRLLKSSIWLQIAIGIC